MKLAILEPGGMTRRALASMLCGTVAWVLWTYSFETLEGRKSTGSWTRVSTAESEAGCEGKKREQIESLLGALAPYGASVDQRGDAVFYATRTTDGRPIMTTTRYLCLPETMDPRSQPQR